MKNKVLIAKRRLHYHATTFTMQITIQYHIWCNTCYKQYHRERWLMAPVHCTGRRVKPSERGEGRPRRFCKWLLFQEILLLQLETLSQHSLCLCFGGQIISAIYIWTTVSTIGGHEKHFQYVSLGWNCCYLPNPFPYVPYSIHVLVKFQKFICCSWMELYKLSVYCVVYFQQRESREISDVPLIEF